MHPFLSILCVAWLGFAAAARADDPPAVGDVFADAAGGAPVLTVERGWRGAEPERILFERFRDRGGRVVASLTSTYSAGGLRSVRYERTEPAESATIDYVDGAAHYAHTRDGRTKRSVGAVAAPHVPFNAIPGFIAAHWDDLAAGQTVALVVPIPLLRDAYNFRATRTRSWAEGGRRLAEFRVESSSLLIRAVSDPIRYVYDAEGRSIVESRGPIAAPVGPAGGSKEFAARVAYRPAAARRAAGVTARP